MPSDPKPDRPRRTTPSGVSLETLAIAAAASVASAFLIARIWGPGTLFGAAAAPVIVALVSEAIRRPIHAVSPAADAPATTPPPAGVRDPVPATPALDTVAAVPADSRGARRWRQWRWALLTGLVGFGIAVGVITVPDLLTGSSITGNGRPTTFFGGATTTRTETLSTPSVVTTTQTVTATTPTVTTSSVTATSTSTTTTVPAATTTTTTLGSTATSATVTSTTPVPTTSGASVTVASTPILPSSATQP